MMGILKDTVKEMKNLITEIRKMLNESGKGRRQIKEA